MTAPTHRFTGTYLHRARTGETLEYGDRFSPTDAERRAFGDCLERLSPDELDRPEDEALSVDEAKAVLESVGLDPEDYNELRSAAADTEHISGRLSKVELQTRLAEHYRE